MSVAPMFFEIGARSAFLFSPGAKFDDNWRVAGSQNLPSMAPGGRLRGLCYGGGVGKCDGEVRSTRAAT